MSQSQTEFLGDALVHTSGFPIETQQDIGCVFLEGPKFP